MRLRHLSFLRKSPSFLGKLSSETTKAFPGILDGFWKGPVHSRFMVYSSNGKKGYEENSPRSVLQKLEKVCLVLTYNSLFLVIYNGLIFFCQGLEFSCKNLNLERCD